MKTPSLALSLLLLASAAQAQRFTEARAAVTPAEKASALVPARGADPVAGMPRYEPPRSSAMKVTGTVFAIAGLFGGAYAGADLACGSGGGDYCGLEGGIVGAILGEVVMLPAGVHYESSNTSYGRKLLVSSAVMLSGMVLAPVTAGLSLLAVPPVQLGMLMRMEHRASERTR